MRTLKGLVHGPWRISKPRIETEVTTRYEDTLRYCQVQVFICRWNETKDPGSLSAEQVHEELKTKAHQQYKDIALVS